MDCKSCSTPLPKSCKPNLTGLCRRCRHKHYAPKYYQRVKDRVKAAYWANPAKFAARHQKYKLENPDAYRARNNRLRRTIAGRFNHGKTRAKRGGLEWSLTKDQHAKLLEKPCAYCAGPLQETGSGLDRMDNARGYTPDNVVPCCVSCNRIKCEFLTHEEMKVAMAAVNFVRVSKRVRLVGA